MRRTAALIALPLALLSLPSGASAQAAWDAPMLMAPGAPAGIGVHLVDPSDAPGSGLGVLGTWRANPAPVGLGFRLGFVEGASDDLAVTGGVDVSGMIATSDAESPFDLMWFAGAGIGIDGDALLSFPAGVSAGLSFEGEQVQFRPYVAPRVVLDAFLGDGVEEDLDLGLTAEIGLDLQFSQPWAIRASGSLGDRESVSIGLVFPGN